MPDEDLSASSSLLEADAPDLMTQAPPPPPAAAPVKLRSFGDPAALRTAIYDNVFDAASTLPPVTNKTHTLALKNVRWADPEHRTKDEEKKAILGGHSLHRRLSGDWELTENASGKVLDKRRQVVLRVPHLTDNGTFIRNGADYIIRHQTRLRPGIFTRIKDSGDAESHVNVLSGGPSHRLHLDPASGIFKISVGQANIPLTPLLRALGASEDEMKEAWGKDLYARNYAKSEGGTLARIAGKFLRDPPTDGTEGELLKKKFEQMKLDPEITRRTLGTPYSSPNKDALLATTKKLMAVSRGETPPDDRDHMAYQVLMGPEDFMKERIVKDRGGVRRTALFKAGIRGNLSRMPTSALQDQLDSIFTESGLAEHVQEVNGLELLDKGTLVTRMGEGGIPSLDSAPKEARAVQPSHYAYFDPLKTPESGRAGLDTHLAAGAMKGSDGNVYANFTDQRTGKTSLHTPQQVIDKTITFPGEMGKAGKYAPVIRGSKMTWARKGDVDLAIPHFEHAFTALNNLVPLKSMVKGQRASMASRMLSQALALKDGEAPLVQNAVPGTNESQSYEEKYGENIGALKAKKGGHVQAVTPGGIQVRYDDGTTENHELHNHRVYNRKSFLHQTPVLQAGQRFEPGQLLAKSNFTDHNGAAALGMNAKVGYMSHGGANFEDAIVISESMAKRFTSDHAYQHQLEMNDQLRAGRKAYVSLFPSKYSKEILSKIDDAGLIKPGMTVNHGDPLILASKMQENAKNRIHRKNATNFTDAAVTWDHHDPGVVTSVEPNAKGGPVVVVRSLHQMQVADKIAGRHGNKGVVSRILPDNQMPHDKDGRPMEVLLNPLGVVSRVNPAQWVEAKLGEIAEKTGKPFKVEDFRQDIPDRIAWVEDLMRKHGVSDTQDLYDPVKGTKIPNVYTGNVFLMKLQHTAEDKAQGRSGGGYTALGEPSKGGTGDSSKRLALMHLSALLSHGAVDVIRDSHLVRGQSNPEYWSQFMQGYTPRDPKVPLVHQKFLADLQGAGINVVKDGSQMHIMAMTNKDVDKLAGDRNIQNGETVNFGDQLKPIAGGLFSPELTGGHHGQRWSALPLTEPMLNPALEEPARRILGLTKQKFMDIMASKSAFADGSKGPAGIASALKSLDVDKELARLRGDIASGRKTKRDEAVRSLGYLKSAKRLGIHPGDWVLNRAPVLPPQFRPVSVMPGKKIPLVADSNFLYRELFEANKNLKDMREQVGPENTGNEQLALYHAFKAVTGLGDPISAASKEKKIQGILANTLGSSPKHGTMQRQLLSTTVDNVGRAVISPDPNLDMDSVNLPEEKAFNVYQRFIARRLKRGGMKTIDALREIDAKSPLARKALLEEMDERPVMVDRAPVLHRYGIMALRPKLIKSSTMQLSPLIFKGFGADNDGDQMNFHVPVSDAARDEALDRMLPSRQLISVADMKSPVHAPTQEYIAGLYQASTNKTKRHHHFRNSQDVQRSWARGDVGLGDIVTILDDIQHKS